MISHLLDTIALDDGDGDSILQHRVHQDNVEVEVVSQEGPLVHERNENNLISTRVGEREDKKTTKTHVRYTMATYHLLPDTDFFDLIFDHQTLLENIIRQKQDQEWEECSTCVSNIAKKVEHNVTDQAIPTTHVTCVDKDEICAKHNKIEVVLTVKAHLFKD